MSWYAVTAIDDAVDATRGFLLPFGLRRWTVLALVAALMGGGPSMNVNPPTTSGNVPRDALSQLPEFSLAPRWGVAIVVVALLLSWLSLGFRFVFYDALRTDAARVWGPLRNRLGQALQLLGFQLLVLAVLVGPVVAVVVGVFTGRFAVVSWSPLLLGAAGLLAAALVLLATLVGRFTREFVLPVMVVEDGGPIAGWRRFWPVLREEWVQYLAYLLVHVVLGVAIAIAQGLVFLLVGGVFVAVGALAGVVVAGVLGGTSALLGSTVGIAALAVLGLALLLALLAVFLPVNLVTTTYLRTYELRVLALTDPALDLLADSVFSESESEPSPSAGR
ncbi:MAG: hypothetical protein ABEH81_07325 [Halopenitus sp.]